MTEGCGGLKATDATPRYGFEDTAQRAVSEMHLSLPLAGPGVQWLAFGYPYGDLSVHLELVFRREKLLPYSVSPWWF